MRIASLAFDNSSYSVNAMRQWLRVDVFRGACSGQQNIDDFKSFNYLQELEN